MIMHETEITFHFFLLDRPLIKRRILRIHPCARDHANMRAIS